MRLGSILPQLEARAVKLEPVQGRELLPTVVGPPSWRLALGSFDCYPLRRGAVQRPLVMEKASVARIQRAISQRKLRISFLSPSHRLDGQILLALSVANPIFRIALPAKFRANRATNAAASLFALEVRHSCSSLRIRGGGGVSSVIAPPSAV